MGRRSEQSRKRRLTIMDNVKLLEIQAAAQQAAVDVVKAQIAKGAPTKGMTKARHVAVVADVVHEILASFADPADDKSVRTVLRAALSGSLLNASQLRQDLEKLGVLVKEGPLTAEYGVE